jgi:hypothetical protein
MDEEEARSYLEHGQPYKLTRYVKTKDYDETHHIPVCTDLKWIQE